MFFQMVGVVLDLAASLVAGACLLRLLMQWQRISFQQPVGQFVFAMTDWLLLPLRRWLALRWAWDGVSLIGAYLVKLVQFLLLWLFTGGQGALMALPWISLLGLAQLVVSALTALVLVWVVLSWVNPGAPLYALVARLSAPFLKPFQRWLPLVGGVDLSPLALLLVLQLAGVLLGRWQMGWM